MACAPVSPPALIRLGGGSGSVSGRGELTQRRIPLLFLVQFGQEGAGVGFAGLVLALLGARRLGGQRLGQRRVQLLEALGVAARLRRLLIVVDGGGQVVLVQLGVSLRQ